MKSRSLSAMLLEHLAPARRPAVEAIDGLEAVLKARYDAGKAAWPEVKVSADAFVTHLARHVAVRAGKGIDVLHTDFYFAVALTLADPKALEMFSRVLVPRLRAVIERRSGVSTLQADDVLATLEDRLLVNGPAGSRIANYSGRGSLDRFLRAAAVNQLTNRLRTSKTEGAMSDALAAALIDPRQNPELAALARDSKAAFATAFQAAFRSLTPRERVLLRLHTFESATITDIGRMYQVHKVTAFRWLEEARDHLKTATRAALRDRLEIDEGELNSFLRQLPASMEHSLKTMFQTLEQP